MRTAIDFSPLFRSSVGFDRVLNLLESASRIDAAEGWPPYDIIRVGDESYRITMAVAGFGADEISIVHEPNLLVISGKKTEEPNTQYLHHGISMREFKRQFELADHVKVTRADLADGLLTVDLEREVPENLKPRMIEISSDTPPDSGKRIGEGKSSAA
ncbi:Hsp20 family protein [Bosea lathyri]|uniref:Molecular chaperone IbpA n=1 Tax=Bosea lathyri TaxID=1036778 RepID=A0A1H5W909_9HYPH|nr:Hsp20 family protein [Bosea lathyri]SEF95935.1 molecular chaperone IbpA [Bosea lathyri]